MKHFPIYIVALLLSSFLFAQEVEWKTMEEADELQKQNPEKQILVDVYTEWCGYCKVMDKKTFANAEVAEFINTNYIPAKLDAETKRVISFKGNQFNYIPAGRSGINEIAYYILGGQMNYPSLVILNSDMTIQYIFRGYYEADMLLEGLKSYFEAKDAE
ncbi:MAG: DUF255 domain-containing protein [Flavobacteriales bacterium]|nr:DUF255 domain-containing protein [Flavobacteriales bacterium]